MPNVCTQRDCRGSYKLFAMESLESMYLTESDLVSMGVAHVGWNVRVSQQATIVGMQNVSLGNNVRVDSYVTILAKRGRVVIGSNVHIEPGASLVGHGEISVGNFCTISHGVRLFTASADYSGTSLTNSFPEARYHTSRLEPITLQDHVILGGNSVVMPGVTIEEGAAIGALSFVRLSVGGWSIYGGNPLVRLSSRSREIRELGRRILERQERGESQNGF